MIISKRALSSFEMSEVAAIKSSRVIPLILNSPKRLYNSLGKLDDFVRFFRDGCCFKSGFETDEIISVATKSEMTFVESILPVLAKIFLTNPSNEVVKTPAPRKSLKSAEFSL